MGSSMAIVVPLVEAGDRAWGLGLAGAQAVVAIITLTCLRRLRPWRPWVFFGAFLVAGQLNAVTTFLKPMPWFESFAPPGPDDALSLTWRLLTAAVCFGLYFVIDLAALFMDVGQGTERDDLADSKGEFMARGR